MKETKVSLYDVEVLSKGSSLSLGQKPTEISAYNIELLHNYVPSSISISIPLYKFEGTVSELISPVERLLFSYDQVTYLRTGESFSTVSGTFLLPSTVSGTCFVVCLDDVIGESYNHLVYATIDPLVYNDYGLVQSNPGKSAYDIKQNNESANVDGLYWIHPVGYAQPLQVYCDMTTHGGGWTMCVRWDRDFTTGWVQCLPLNALRLNINTIDLMCTNVSGTYQSATLDVRPIISAGATMFMHRSADIADTCWKYTYFSDIYQSVLDDPDVLFDAVIYDTNDAEEVTGTVVNGYSSSLKTRWYDKDLTLLTVDLEGIADNYFLYGGEGTAMFTNGSTDGAIYSSHNNSTCDGHNTPPVCWGFYGKDNSVSDYTYGYTTLPRVGTNSGADYTVSSRFNFMFIR